MALAAGPRRMARTGRLLFDFWPARCGKIAPCLGNLSGEEPSAVIPLARVCGGRGLATTPPTRPDKRALGDALEL